MDLEMKRPFWFTQVDYKPSTRHHKRHSEEKTQKRRQCDHKAETAVMQPQVRDADNSQKLPEAKDSLSLEPC